MTWARAWSDVLDVLCPMHVLLDNDGVIRNAGPTLAKLRPEREFRDTAFFDRFKVLRPRIIGDVRALADHAGRPLHLQLADDPPTTLKGVAQNAPAAGGVIVDLSFDFTIVDAVNDYALTNADFAPTDMAVEMLWLVEAKSAAFEASRLLNLRLRGAAIAAEEQAFTDTLTGVKNRRALDHVLDRLTRGETPFAMMHVDLDHFKKVNDTLGHAAGDHVLQRVAGIMVELTRKSDTVARVGGDEFVLIFDNLTDRDALDSIALRLIERLQEPIAYGGELCRISCSIGTVLSTDYPAPDLSRMLDDADVALYASKREGRARHTYYARRLRRQGGRSRRLH